MVHRYNPDIHHRRSVRLKGYDYAATGAYFITICAHERECLFGEVVDGEVRLSRFGEIVLEEWEKSETIRENIILDEFIVMPNHIHGILFVIDGDGGGVGATRWVAQNEPTHPNRATQRVVMDETSHQNRATQRVVMDETSHQNRATQRVAPTAGVVSGSIGAVIGQFKSAATKRINALRNNPGCPVWQRNYYDRVIRSEKELANIRQYIADNPAKWDLDENNPVNAANNP